jgi:hypothetical protein
MERRRQWELVGEHLQRQGRHRRRVDARPVHRRHPAAVDDQDAPVDPIDISNPTLPDGTPTIYAFFNGIDVPAGTTWTSAWFLNGESASDPKDHTWDFAPNEGNWISFGTNDDSPMDSGTYQLKLTIDGRLVNMATFIMP